MGRNRPFQDFIAWKSFGTQAFWAELLAAPHFACEMLSQMVSKLGCVNASEPTSASLAGAALWVTYGAEGAARLSTADINAMYNRIKVLHVACSMHAVTRR